MPKTRRTSRPKGFALHWCTTADGEAGWFVVADSARSASLPRGRRDRRRVRERVVGLPTELQTLEGWLDGSDGKVYARSGLPSDEFLVACGGEIAPLPRTKHDARIDVVYKDVRFGGCVFRAGDIVTVRDRARGIKQARISVFKGPKPKVPPR